MLSCKEVVKKTSDYIDGNLTTKERFEIWLHTLWCYKCRRFIKYFRSVFSSEMIFDTETLDEASADKIVEKVTSESSTSQAPVKQ